MSPPTVLDAIRELLNSQGVAFREVHHDPTFTSEQSALARGEELRNGGKALLLKGEDDQYRLFVLPADRKLDSAAVRKRLGAAASWRGGSDGVASGDGSRREAQVAQ